MGFFSLDDPVEGITDPLDYKHMAFLRFVLRIISGWPGQALGEKILAFEGMKYAYYNTSLSLVYLVSGIAYLRLHMAELTFLELGHNYIVLLMNILSTSRAFTLCLSKKYRVVAIDYIRKFHLFHHKDKSDYAMDIHVKVHRISHYFSIYITGIQWVALILFNLTPVFNNYRSGKYSNIHENLVNTTYEHAIYFVFPFNSDSNFKGYIYASVINWYGSYLCASSVCMFDLFLSLMIFTIYGHFKILIHSLSSFPKPAAISRNDGDDKVIGECLLYSETEQKEVADKLKDCVQYHQLIVSFTTKMSDAFGMALLVYLMFHQVSGCLLLLECSQLNPQALTRYLPLTILMFGQLIQLSIIFETVGTMSEKIKDAVYCLPWEHMDTRNRKTVFMYLMKVQEPIHVNAGGLLSVGVTTMASIIKTSFSYFAFLRTVPDS